MLDPFEARLADALKTTKTADEYVDVLARTVVDELGDDPLVEEFCGAFAKSLTKKGDDVPGYHDIFNGYGLSRTQIQMFHLCLRKEDAKIFLQRARFPIQSSFENNFTYDKYIRDFNRCPGIWKNGQLLLTYVEWIDFVGNQIYPKVPRIVSDILNGR